MLLSVVSYGDCLRGRCLISSSDVRMSGTLWLFSTCQGVSLTRQVKTRGPTRSLPPDTGLRLHPNLDGLCPLMGLLDPSADLYRNHKHTMWKHIIIYYLECSTIYYLYYIIYIMTKFITWPYTYWWQIFMDYSATVAYTYLVHLKMDATLDLCFVLVEKN